MSQSREKAESFLARWSRRKRGKQPQEHGRQPPAPDASAHGPQAGPSATTEAAAPQDAPLPEDLQDFSPETLDVNNTDFSRFLQEDVPEHIRRAALRKLWESDETLANLDGLNDYDEDFTPAGMLQAAQDFLRRVADASMQDDDDAPSVSDAKGAEKDRGMNAISGKTRDSLPEEALLAETAPELDSADDEDGR